MKSVKILAVALACMALAALVPAAALAAGQESQTNSDAGRRAQTQATPTDRNASEARAGEDVEEQDEATTPPPQESEPGRSVPARTRRRSESRYRFEFGVMPRYISNYFQAQDEFNSASTTTPIKSVYITTLSGSFEYDLVHKDRSTLTAGLRVRRNFFKDLAGADSTDVDVTLNYNFQPNQLRFGYFGTPRRLVAVVGGRNIYGETNGFSAEYFRRVTRRWRARGGYQFARETFSEFRERDLSRHQIHGDLRYQVSPYFTPGVGFEYTRGNAESENFSYNRPALLLILTSRVRDAAYLSFRYRFSDRDYVTGVPTDSNFGREDRRHDVSFYGTVNLGRGFSLFGFAYHTDSNSNRVTRTFTSYETGLGLFYRFP